MTLKIKMTKMIAIKTLKIVVAIMVTMKITGGDDDGDDIEDEDGADVNK